MRLVVVITCCANVAGIHIGGAEYEKGMSDADGMICKVMNDVDARICRLQIDNN